GGRTFEAFGEDPFLSGYIAVANIIGIQEQGISAESKHFACNNQETNRRFINTIVDERTLREIYLPAFEAAVKQGKVDAVMSAYNIVNASFCSENMILLHDILRGEWGFDGYVTSDFGAVQSTIPSAMAGTDVEMQKGKYYSDSLREAVNSGRVPMKVLDDMLVRRISKMMYRGVFHQPLPNEPIPSQAHGALARRIAAAGMVLLKNAKGLLPLTASQVKSIALIGRYAADAMTGGGGSSAVTPSYIVTPLTGIQTKVRSGVSVQLNDGSDITAAAALARRVDVAIVMVGDSLREGRDFSISLSGNQDTLVRAVANANPRTVVVLKTGTAALMPWINNVSAVLEAWYPGEEDGNAVADVLFGDVNPSGKLPLTFPENELDLPAQVVKDSTTNYREGVFVGYRYFDASNKTPLFPFGHGLSYTTFQYHNLSLGPVGAGFDANPHQKVSVELDVTNSGAVAGSEAVQIYVGMPSATVLQPPKQLKGVQKIQLTPGQTGHIRLKLDFRSFAYWDTTRHDWSVAPGNYQILVGSSSRDIRLQGQIKIPGSR
ncbi:MAG: glycoside hydrolase family 3 C-terminal domain-containing protein, partial [Ignavibacteriales bacterium]|nr:glycoside hydrolase family 3 C-terminal domain-containing protein [Ignavibacteriales bacterium]